MPIPGINLRASLTELVVDRWPRLALVFARPEPAATCRNSHDCGMLRRVPRWAELCNLESRGELVAKQGQMCSSPTGGFRMLLEVRALSLLAATSVLHGLWTVGISLPKLSSTMAAWTWDAPGVLSGPRGRLSPKGRGAPRRVGDLGRLGQCRGLLQLSGETRPHGWRTRAALCQTCPARRPPRRRCPSFSSTYSPPLQPFLSRIEDGGGSPHRGGRQ